MITLTNEQDFLINDIIKWYNNSNTQIYEFSGGPGTGKSTILIEVIRRLDLDVLSEVAAVSFTGTAALNLRLKEFPNAKTAHSLIYNVEAVPLRDKYGNIVKDTLLNVPILIPKFRLVSKLDDDIKLIVIDEAYSLPATVGRNIEKFGIRILACGDPNQLPPVNDLPAYLNDNNHFRLTKCMRQLGKEDITFIANTRAKLIPLINGYYGNSLVINKNQLTNDMLLWADIVICGTNKTRDYYNNLIRNLKGYTTDLPQYGEKVICRSNNWLDGVELSNGTSINLTNGMVCKVLNNPDISSYDGEQFSMTLAPELAPNAIFFNTRCNYKHMISDFKIRDSIRKNRYSKGNMFEYAYAITTYLSQGGQWHNVIYIEEYMGANQSKINLVGASRADTRLIYVKM